MRKALVLGILTIFVMTVLSGTMMAVQPSKIMPIKGIKATLVGKVVYSPIERPHYELATARGNYILTGAHNFKAYVGKTVRATGIIYNLPNIFMRGPIFSVQEVKS